MRRKKGLIEIRSTQLIHLPGNICAYQISSVYTSVELVDFEENCMPVFLIFSFSTFIPLPIFHFLGFPCDESVAITFG